MQSAQLATSTLTEFTIGFPTSGLPSSATPSTAGRRGSREGPPARVDRVHDRLADVARLEQRQPVDVGADEFRKAPQDPLALLRLHAPPRAGLETGSRRVHRGIDIRGPAAGHLTQDLAVDGTDVIEHAAVAGRDRAACDEGAAFGPHAGGQPFPGAAVALQGRGAHGTKLP